MLGMEKPKSIEEALAKAAIERQGPDGVGAREGCRQHQIRREAGRTSGAVAGAIRVSNGAVARETCRPHWTRQGEARPETSSSITASAATVTGRTNEDADARDAQPLLPEFTFSSTGISFFIHVLHCYSKNWSSAISDISCRIMSNCPTGLFINTATH